MYIYNKPVSAVKHDASMMQMLHDANVDANVCTLSHRQTSNFDFAHHPLKLYTHTHIKSRALRGKKMACRPVSCISRLSFCFLLLQASLQK
jgi:hypothetical protein